MFILQNHIAKRVKIFYKSSIDICNKSLNQPIKIKGELVLKFKYYLDVIREIHKLYLISIKLG